MSRRRGGEKDILAGFAGLPGAAQSKKQGVNCVFVVKARILL
ncbi:hypothetical protein HMPREF9371_2168 [Neisseria shayeganii 871]|uniref:Uncharacterized protein n=1 Tax=Neisseria shayeganii 871 TaxID=1032488 RepID=G4CKM8_9NEIS|nr:hypothetical protein HMPREF9371_2168 [Neisseria shayeganii 871]